jgi:hypothetical protein
MFRAARRGDVAITVTNSHTEMIPVRKLWVARRKLAGQSSQSYICLQKRSRTFRWKSEDVTEIKVEGYDRSPSPLGFLRLHHQRIIEPA